MTEKDYILQAFAHFGELISELTNNVEDNSQCLYRLDALLQSHQASLRTLTLEVQETTKFVAEQRTTNRNIVWALGIVSPLVFSLGVWMVQNGFAFRHLHEEFQSLLSP
jgi:hypothetical protein